MIVALLASSAFLAVGVALKRIAPPTIVPAAILGGLVALALRQVSLLPGEIQAWQEVAYHLFGISFLSIGLTPGDAGTGSIRRGTAWMGLTQGMTFSLQAVAGGLVVVALNATGSDLFDTFGFFAALGLNEGPGQALSIGTIWEAEGFSNAVAVGLTVASLGFVAAYGPGLLLVRRLGGRAPAGKDWFPGIALRTPRALVTAAIYGVIFVSVQWVTGLIGPGVQTAVLGFLFFVCLLIGMGLRLLFPAGWFSGPGQRPTTALAVEGLTVATLGSLAWESVAEVIVPILGVTLAALAVTAVVLTWALRFVREYRNERLLALYGTVTGTAASGLILLNTLDHGFETPVAVELGAMNAVAAPFILTGVAIVSLPLFGWSLLATTGMLALLALVSAALLAVAMTKIA